MFDLKVSFEHGKASRQYRGSSAVVMDAGGAVDGVDGAPDERDIEGMTWAQMMRATGYSEASAAVMRESILEQRRFDVHIFDEEDDLGAIVRGLLYIEHDLRKILTEGPGRESYCSFSG